jgi:hypothetical protein
MQTLTGILCHELTKNYDPESDHIRKIQNKTQIRVQWFLCKNKNCPKTHVSQLHFKQTLQQTSNHTLKSAVLRQAVRILNGHTYHEIDNSDRSDRENTQNTAKH